METPKIGKMKKYLTKEAIILLFAIVALVAIAANMQFLL